MTIAAQATALRQAIPWQQIQDGIYDWVAQNTGLPVIWARLSNGALQPPRAYAAIDIVGGPKMQGRDGQGKQTNTSANAGQEVQSVLFGLRSLTVTVNVFSEAMGLADSAMSYATALQASLALDSVIDQLRFAGLAVSVNPAIRNLAEMQESVWVSRAEVEVGFTTAMFTAFGDQQGYISEVTGAATVKDDQPTNPSTNTFDVKGL